MVTDIDRQTLHELIESGAQIVDVLPEREYASGHLPGAVNIPLKKLNAATASVLRRDKPVVVY
jgi:rhodanese-related sulfurtransferase